ncbi:MAG: hypothetical protein RSF73_09220 [Ruthenibacterium sp.]
MKINAKHLRTIGCIIAFFLILIIFANPIVHFIAKYSIPMPDKTENKFAQNMGDIIVSVNRTTVEKIGLFDNISIEGWAIDTKQEKIDKQTIMLYLSSDKYTYKIPTTQLAREDVAEAHKQDNKVQFGYKTNFSTAFMKNGIYTLYLGCATNDGPEQFIGTSLNFKKNYREFACFYQAGDAKLKSKTEDSSEEILCSITDYNTKDDNSAFIFGWGAIEDQDARQTPIYFELEAADGQKKLYEGTRTVRADVAEYYTNELYKMSGFELMVDLNKLVDGEYKISILCEDSKDGTFTRQTLEETLRKSDNKISIAKF